MKKSEKSPEMEALLGKMAKEFFGSDRTGKQCATCRSTAVKAEDFRDDLSRKEFGISMMCQCCQDQVLGPNDPFEEADDDADDPSKDRS